MRKFIERVVALAPDTIVLTISAGQFLVGLGLALGKGILFRVGAVGAASFLVGISWLGFGSAFPLNLVLAAGALLLLRRSRPRSPARGQVSYPPISASSRRRDRSSLR